MSTDSVKYINEKAMTEFIQARTCQRKVLSQYFNREREGVVVDCTSTDSVFCD
jgi:hypothetical protein